MRHLMSRTRSVVTAALFGLALVGCGGHNTDNGIIPNSPTTLKIDNESFNDMRIYVRQGGQRIRIGTATGKQTSTFKLPKSIVPGFTTLRVEAVPIGANGRSISEEITVIPGDDLMLRIEP
jgi:hypothetical protein